MRSLRVLVLATAAAAATTIASPAHAAPVQLTATLSALEETLPGPTGATGSATIDFKTDTNEVCYALVTQNLTDPLTAGHIHKGAKGAPGDVVIDLKVTAGKLTGCVPADAAKIQAVLADPQGHYVNLHTQANPDGAMRGQLVSSITNPETAATTGSSQSGAPALARTGPGSAALLAAIGFVFVSAGTAARLARRRL